LNPKVLYMLIGLAGGILNVVLLIAVSYVVPDGVLASRCASVLYVLNYPADLLTRILMPNIILGSLVGFLLVLAQWTLLGYVIGIIRSRK
jgi:hypothetical protein